MLLAILQIVKDVRRKCWRLASKSGTKCTYPEMHGFCNFPVFVHQKSKAPERVKRDPHLFDLVIFLHPKKCLTCGGENRKVCAPFGSGNGPRNLCLVVFLTSNGISEPKFTSGFWHFCNSLWASELLAVQNILMCKKTLSARVAAKVRKPSLARGDCLARVPVPRC